MSIDQNTQPGPAISDAPALIAETLFPGDSEMARLMRALDWAQTALGPVATWSPSLRMMVRFLLSNRFPLLLWWGPAFLQLYNDAYRPVLGTKHPQYLGRSVRECWSEIWDVIGPLIETPFNGGPATWMEDILLEVNRNGFFEETHFTIAYSPVPDETAPNGIGGVLATVHEISEKVVGERRVVVLRDLGARSAEAKTAEEACQIAAKTLAQHPKDLPFALLYLIDPDGTHARLAAVAGTGTGRNTRFSPPVIALGTESGAAAGDGWVWPLTEVMRTETMRVVDDLASRYEAVPPGPWSDPPHTAVVVPIRSNIAHHLAGFLVAGVSARLRFDDGYAGFFELVSSQLATAIANARAYEEERRRAEALAAIDRAKTTFFSNVSHEFRTPLTLLLGPLEESLAATDEGLSPRQRERLEVMRRNGLRLLKLVNTLLDFARIEAGRVRAVYEPTDLAALTADLASAFRSLVEKAGMELVVDCPPLAGGLREPSYVDREMWEKIVLNLLSNAFKFTLAGSIIVTLRAVDGGAVELTVRDTGTGIPAHELPRLFERFHRVEGARARTHEGSGIGLALVQELVHLHGGTIRAESAEGSGTTFFVRLPAGTAHLPAERVQPDQARATLAPTALGATAYVEEAGRWLSNDVRGDVTDGLDGLDGLDGSVAPGDAFEPVTPAPTLSGNASPARIILADDNADMREYLRRLLSERYTVEAVANGVQALTAIRRDPRALPDLVLSDVMMPELDGFGLLRELRADPRTATLPVMLLSARAGEESTIEGLAAGADDYLVKPFSAREVLSRVAARLEIARTRAEAEQRMHTALTALLRMAEALVVTPQDADDARSEPGQPGQAAGRARTARTGAVRRVLALIQRVFAGQHVGAALLSFDTDGIDPLAVVGLTPEIEEHWWADLRQKPLSAYIPPPLLERFRAEEVIEFDFDSQPPIPGQDYFGVQRMLFVAQQLSGSQLCAIGVEVRNQPAFTPQERELVRAAVRLVALVVERDRLLREREEGQLRELALEEATRRMDEFLGIASHELRTPLTSIMANVQLAGRQLRDLSQSSAQADTADGPPSRLERAGRLLERTDRQVARMDRLVGDLLDASRIQAGKLEMRPEPCDLLKLVREAVQEQRTAWPGRAITLDLPHRAAAPLHADVDRIGQVVTNYLTNALKYSPDDQPVEVRVWVRGDAARVDVRDRGPGLSPEQQAQIFERFYRVPGIEQQSGSGVGLGLGLYICKTIVERHGGAVGVESAPGEGATFWFTLPLAASACATV